MIKIRSGVAWLLLAAFLSLGLAAVLPHVHTDQTPAGHDCFACRAQSAHAVIEPPASNPISFAYLGTVVPQGAELISQVRFTSFSSRAPPFPA